MRIACLQFAPRVGDVENNIRRADAVLNQANPQDIDLLVLPELAFTGYKFRSLQHVTPYLEDATAGVTAEWARKTAEKYNCFVVVGYPETVDVSNHWPADPEYYNSAMLVNAAGETVVNYRKKHLYYLDETWALEGPEFYTGGIPWLGKIAMGICMDLKQEPPQFIRRAITNSILSPYKFEAPGIAWEFASHVLQSEAKLVIISMAWMTCQQVEEYTAESKEPDMNALAYWLSRLDPLIRAEKEEEIVVVIASRCGIEDGIAYAGTSCVLGFQGSDVKFYGRLGRGETELLVVNTSNTADFRLHAVNDVDIKEDVFQSRKAREFLASSETRNTKWESDRERIPEPQVSVTARALTRGIPSIEVILSGSSPQLSVPFFTPARSASNERRGKGKHHRPEEAQSSMESVASSIQLMLPKLKLDTPARSENPLGGGSSSDRYPDQPLMSAPISRNAPPTPWASTNPDDTADSASSMIVNYPWKDTRSSKEAQDDNRATRSAGAGAKHSAFTGSTDILFPTIYEPQQSREVGGQIGSSTVSDIPPNDDEPIPGSTVSTVPPLFSTFIPPTERPKSPKSRNTSRSRPAYREPAPTSRDLVDQSAGAVTSTEPAATDSSE